MEEHAFSRTELIIGEDNLSKLKNSTVVIFGIGGVGSFATEALTRSGIGNLILIDNDTVSISNLNRQIIANLSTIGMSKVEVMKKRIESINPNCNVITHEIFAKENNLLNIITPNADYVIDAIDTVSSKLSLISLCKDKNIPIISSMGTGNKLDPTRFKIADIYETKVCPLAKVMRYELRKRNIPNLKVLYSEEVPIKIKSNDESSTNSIKKTRKKIAPGSISFVPPVAGMIIASQVIKDILKV
ncbi:tRNA threonylcarbamoyladenosine dehydratase [Clostridium tetani]|uniref:tRNA threonylcarbamoyladenosine dehydratase n=1 Tax=Clostridium tetani TaxID=1513 RepID=UPI00100C2AAD|nr:tRNA threonylcarbamoyladenosine dehydratase [Clostridium tetani]RXM57889.1 tRNA threonylcarbamoyladenosine dehydratase [Clostridium tetani]RXM76636.1 tRNA threonylcarbamoyladenosine dehydratase [Clostridium tetani]RYU99134.1 tRNA threonylcarbamoyladenosine dehydratase [Clostridium tetani]